MTHLTNSPFHRLDYTHVEALCMYLHQMGVYVDRNTQLCEPWTETISVMAFVLNETTPMRHSTFHGDFRRYNTAHPLAHTNIDKTRIRSIRRQLEPFRFNQTHVSTLDDDTFHKEEMARIGKDHMYEDMLHFVQSCMSERISCAAHEST